MNDMLKTALDALPHGPEFRFVDSVDALEPGVAGRGRYRVRGDEGFLAGHFPGRPMMPGVILLEALAQLGGVVVQADPAHAPLGDLRLTGIRAAKILAAAVPGDELEIRVRVEGRVRGLVQVAGEISTAAGLLATGKVTLSGVVDATQPQE